MGHVTGSRLWPTCLGYILQPPINVHITNQPLTDLSVAKYLGIDSYKKWDVHIGKLIRKVSAKVQTLGSKDTRKSDRYFIIFETQTL